ncbi:MAG: sugar ABC transporter permease [Chlorobia bacterium]|nr:sugar ABC transporter permease [Fimbriimonadaceae bacterium]
MTFAGQRKWTSFFLVLPYLCTFLIFVGLPFLVAIVLAFVKLDLADKGSSKFVGFGNFVDVFNDPLFYKALDSTGRYAILMVPSVIIIGFAMAMGMNAMTKGRDMVRTLIYLPSMLNVAATGILWQWFFNNQFGLFNFGLQSVGATSVPWISDKSFAMPSVVIMSLWWTVGGTSVVLLTGLQQIPKVFIEAASLDGANATAVFRKITIPMLRPVLLFVFITSTIAAFQMFGQAFILTGGGPEFSTRGLVQYMYETAFNGYRFGYGAAIGWILFAIVLVFALGQARLVRSGRV